MNKEFFEALELLAQENGIPMETLIEKMNSELCDAKELYTKISSEYSV